MKSSVLVFLFCIQALAATDEEMVRVSQSKTWLRLLNYKPGGWFSQDHSYVDGPGFFFSPDGKYDPLAELKATVESFSKDIKIGPLGQHPQCAFPERFRFLKSELHLEIQQKECTKYQEFLSRFKGQSVTLVYSSAYPNNPGSALGHTFLKINSKVKTDLLDYGISYAARVSDDENGVKFLFYGVFGGYVGQFSMLPYYEKVNEYSNSESRDVWEYELNFSPEETQRLLGHAWELETNSHLDYFFFDENCALILLSLLESAKPEWNLTEGFWAGVIPGETVKKVTQIENAVKRVNFRPSLHKKLRAIYGNLSPESKSDFEKIRTMEMSPGEIQDPVLAETAALYMQYKKQKTNSQTPEEKQRESAFRLRMSQLPVSNYSLDVDDSSRPDLGHDAYNIAVGGGYLKGGKDVSVGFLDLDFRGTYHDLLDRDLGFSRFSQIQFPEFHFRIIPAEKVYDFERIGLVSATSLFPMSFLEKRFSWKLSIQMYRPSDFGVRNTLVGQLLGAGGASFELLPKSLIGYVMASGRGEIGDALAKGYRLGPGLMSGLVGSVSDTVKFLATGQLLWDLFQDDRQEKYYLGEAGISFSPTRNEQVRAVMSHVEPTTSRGTRYNEVKVLLSHYF